MVSTITPTDRFAGGNFNPGLEGLNQRGNQSSQFADIARLLEFDRKDRPLGFFESILARQGGIEDLISGFKNPFTSKITEGLESAATRVRGLRGQLDGLPAALRGSALASTSGAQVAALNAAQQSSGRGGTAFGGGSKEIQTRAAQQAATQQSSALAQAIVQGQQLRGQFNLQQAGLETNIGSLLAQARSRQAGIAESGFNRQLGARSDLQQIIASLAGATGRPSTGRASDLAGDIGGIVNLNLSN